MKLPLAVIASLCGLILLNIEGRTLLPGDLLYDVHHLPIGRTPGEETTYEFIVKSETVAVVQWQEGRSRPIGEEFTARGLCEYIFDDFYPEGQVFVNVSFADKVITTFEDYGTWVRNDSSPGFWYFSASRWPYNPGQPVRIDFDVEWNQTLGAALPNAECETNVGTAVTTTPIPTTTVP